MVLNKFNRVPKEKETRATLGRPMAGHRRQSPILKGIGWEPRASFPLEPSMDLGTRRQYLRSGQKSLGCLNAAAYELTITLLPALLPSGLPMACVPPSEHVNLA